MYFLELLSTSPGFAFLFLAAIILAITIHEYAHAWTAYRLGDDTPYLMGRVSLSPFAHLDPIGSLAFLLLGFGWGKPVLYNPLRLSHRLDELWVALAGPISNILLAILLNGLALLLPVVFTGLSAEPLRFLALINIYLAAFNMLPIPPLDGSSIIAYFWPQYRSLAGGQIGLIILLMLIFLPGPGGGRLLTALMDPLIALFSQFGTLFGLLT